MNDRVLMDMASKRLWIASAFIDGCGEITFDIDGFDTFLAANCRSLARGRMPGWQPFAVCSSLEEASQACDALFSAMRKHAASHGRRWPRTVEEKFARLMRMGATHWAKQPTKKDAADLDPDEELDAVSEAVDER